MLDDRPTPDLTGADVLLSGTHDPFARMAPALEHAFREVGAALDAHSLSIGHELGAAVLEVAKAWLDQRAPTWFTLPAPGPISWCGG